MDDSNVPSRYVRLTKEKEPLEDIAPGELNQPVQVPELIVHRCPECGQPLPECYVPPADEDWTTGICGCLEDTESLLDHCILLQAGPASFVHGGMVVAGATLLFHGIDPKTSFLICETLVFAWWLCGIYNCLFRQSLQKKYHLKNSPCDPCIVHCCLHWCALCQEHREMKNHLCDNSEMQMTIVKPPPVQEMNSDDPKQEPAASSRNGEHTKLEIQPV
ncbi:hypothetical protein CRYUN_Cryun20dG0013700 [Craigia yunnanensis]